MLHCCLKPKKLWLQSLFVWLGFLLGVFWFWLVEGFSFRGDFFSIFLFFYLFVLLGVFYIFVGVSFIFIISWLSQAVLTTGCNQQSETGLLFLLPLSFPTPRPLFALLPEIVGLVYMAETFLSFWRISQHMLVPTQGRNCYSIFGLGENLCFSGQITIGSV